MIKFDTRPYSSSWRRARERVLKPGYAVEIRFGTPIIFSSGPEPRFVAIVTRDTPGVVYPLLVQAFEQGLVWGKFDEQDRQHERLRRIGEQSDA